mmetsp:Transcript_36714/g.88767  ORF Transcript_36714/g.88767 Transcript_36714/m.88767 type:complete len:255 (-) Transcript_36714:238-1002(-)
MIASIPPLASIESCRLIGVLYCDELPEVFSSMAKVGSKKYSDTARPVTKSTALALGVTPGGNAAAAAAVEDDMVGLFLLLPVVVDVCLAGVLNGSLLLSPLLLLSLFLLPVAAPLDPSLSLSVFFLFPSSPSSSKNNFTLGVVAVAVSVAVSSFLILIVSPLCSFCCRLAPIPATADAKLEVGVGDVAVVGDGVVNVIVSVVESVVESVVVSVVDVVDLLVVTFAVFDADVGVFGLLPPPLLLLPPPPPPDFFR